MKKYKQILADVAAAKNTPGPALTKLLWYLICYPPKFPPRLQQQQLLDIGSAFSLPVHDPHFSHSQLAFNGFTWGSGKHKILLAHGWGSKAADHHELINHLIALDDVQVIAFDAPANGSSEGELSNLLLFEKAIRAIIAKFGMPHVLIGHSLGAMANVMALNDAAVLPSLLISLTPLIKLKENFIATLNAAAIGKPDQDAFFADFEKVFGTPADYFNWGNLYKNYPSLKQYLIYSQADVVAPVAYIHEFLGHHPEVVGKYFDGISHERILRHPEAIAYIVGLVDEYIKNAG